MMQPAKRPMMAYQTIQICRSEGATRRRKQRLRSLLIFASLVCFSLAALAGFGILSNRISDAVYGAHIKGWHKVVVHPGDTLYGYAEDANAGYVPSVVQAIETKNGMQSAEIYAGQALWVPIGGNQ